MDSNVTETKMNHIDLAKKDHWDNIYEGVPGRSGGGWEPSNYDALALEYALMKEIADHKPRSFLEIGCGNSVWLPYLARRTSAVVAGIDYSEAGCRLAQQRLATEGIQGKIFCVSVFDVDPDEVGQYDFVFSLGVVEHFADLEGTVQKLSEFVAPGGVLFTEVPNLWLSPKLWSIHGLLSWIWQPNLLGKHARIGKRALVDAYEHNGMRDIHGAFLGLFSLNVVAWELYPRWPALARLMIPSIRVVASMTDCLSCHIKRFKGMSPFAPFLYVVGQKPDVADEQRE